MNWGERGDFRTGGSLLQDLSFEKNWISTLCVLISIFQLKIFKFPDKLFQLIKTFKIPFQQYTSPIYLADLIVWYN